MAFTAFPKTENLHYYDVYPKVFVKGRETEIHIRQLGAWRGFEPGKEYEMVICALNGGSERDYISSDFRHRKITCDAEGNFTFKHTFDSEQEYFIRFLGDDGRKLNQFAVYCVDEDLAGRYPLMGDLHMHTTRSDGQQCPAVVCANYRRRGLDFMVVSDHCRYYPSLEAINIYKDVNTGLAIIPGEEVHMPDVDGVCPDFHTVNFGGTYSINALTDGEQTKEKGTGKEFRSLNGECPDFMPVAEWEKMIKEKAATMDVPEGINPNQAAVCKWIYDEIRKADGLGIFPHPYWISDVLHVPEVFTEYITKNKFFDAFEVLGGENYYEQNGWQTLKYYEDRAKGYRYPVVGSTDSHSSTELNRNAYICSTIVFSPANERKALVESIKDFYSVAVDTISTEYRLVGEVRFVRYGTFLLNNYFPIHDDYCIEEGLAMKAYAMGTDEEKADAKQVLDLIGGRTQKLLRKYFAF